jgi:hypothetical protein
MINVNRYKVLFFMVLLVALSTNVVERDEVGLLTLVDSPKLAENKYDIVLEAHYLGGSQLQKMHIKTGVLNNPGWMFNLEDKSANKEYKLNLEGENIALEALCLDEGAGNTNLLYIETDDSAARLQYLHSIRFNNQSMSLEDIELMQVHDDLAYKSESILQCTDYQNRFKKNGGLTPCICNVEKFIRFKKKLAEFILSIDANTGPILSELLTGKHEEESTDYGDVIEYVEFLKRSLFDLASVKLTTIELESALHELEKSSFIEILRLNSGSYSVIQLNYMQPQYDAISITLVKRINEEASWQLMDVTSGDQFGFYPPELVAIENEKTLVIEHCIECWQLDKKTTLKLNLESKKIDEVR